MGVVILFLLLGVAVAVVKDIRDENVLTNLLAGRNASYTLWCKIVIMPNRRGRGGNQPPEEWTNYSISVFPYLAKGFQFTFSRDSQKADGSAYMPVAWSHVFDGIIQNVHFSLFWWNDVFEFYLGMLDPKIVNISSSALSLFSSRAKGNEDGGGQCGDPFCDVDSVVYGKEPPR